MSDKKNLKFHIIFWFSTLLLLAMDQFTKYLAAIHLKNQPATPLIENIFSLQYLENRGAAFGIMQGGKVFFVILTIIFLFLAFWIYCRLPLTRRNYPIYVILSLFLAGAVGNFIDRVTMNYVIDFFYFELINFPIFNVADMCLTFGVIIVIIALIKDEKDE